jgi:hypothetical protein
MNGMANGRISKLFQNYESKGRSTDVRWNRRWTDNVYGTRTTYDLIRGAIRRIHKYTVK